MYDECSGNESVVHEINLYTVVTIKALASSQGSEKKKKKKTIAKNPNNLASAYLPIYVFDDSEQKFEFKVRIKPCSHQPNCMKFLL